MKDIEGHNVKIKIERSYEYILSSSSGKVNSVRAAVESEVLRMSMRLHRVFSRDT